MKLMQISLASSMLVGAGLLVVTGYSNAGGAGQKGILDIAALIEKGDNEAATKAAAALAKKLEDLHELMHTYKPRAKKGLGVGNVGEATPDGIELMVRDLSRDAPGQAKLDKEAAALTKMGYNIAAIAAVTLVMAPEKDLAGGKTIKKWQEYSKELRELSVEFAKAVATKSPAAVKAAASKVNANCNSCHSDFR